MSKNNTKATRDLSEDQLKQREESKQRKQDETEKKKEEYRQNIDRAKENREKAEAIAKAQSKKKQGSNLSYHIMFAVLGAVCVYVIAMMFLNQAPPLNKVPVIDDKRIEEHNNNSYWKQGPNEFFEGATLAVAKTLMNVGFASHQNLNRCQLDDAETPPESFHYKDKFERCMLPSPNMTKSCGGSYAFAIAQTVAERACITNGAERAIPLSAQELLKCDIMNNGCKNGHLNIAFDHIRSKGLVEEECLPYKPDAEKCEGMCDKQKRTRIDSYCLLVGEDDIKREIMRNGPVVSSMYVYVDFLNYKSGVYTKGEDLARFSGQHAIRIVGWGVESGNENEPNVNNKYWIVQNTWGTSWGDEGFAKISFSQDLFFDQYSYAPKIRAMPNISLDNVNFTPEQPEKTKKEESLDLEDDGSAKEEPTQ